MRSSLAIRTGTFLVSAAALLLGAACGSDPSVACRGDCDNVLAASGGTGGSGGAGGASGSTTSGIVITDGAGGGGGATSGGGDECIDVTVQFEEQVPTVLLLIDQSGSMTQDFGDTDRWEAVGEALFDEDDGVVAALEDRVRFGVSLYTSDNGFSNGGTCPKLTGVNPALGNLEATAAVFEANEPGDDTPTGDAIHAVISVFDQIEESGPKVIVLATDGEPDTCEEPDPQNGQDESIAAAQAAYEAGVDTYIISVGEGVSLEHLQDMANAGVGVEVGGDLDAPFYQALEPQGLVDQFQSIINGVRPCTLTLDAEVEPDQAESGTVELDGQVLPYDDEDGWRLASSTEVELLGAACEAIQQGEPSIEIHFPCDAFVEPPR